MVSLSVDKRRVSALFRAIGSDYLFREQFVTDPAQILVEYLHGTPLKRGQADAANQLVFAMLSNPGLLEWLSTYDQQRADDSDEQFTQDLAEALAKHGDAQVQLAVMRGRRPEGRPVEHPVHGAARLDRGPRARRPTGLRGD